MKEKLSVIIPVWGEKELVPLLYNRLVDVLKQLPVEYEIIYINDDCPHGSIIELEKIVDKDKKTTLINLSRNFGEAIAVKVGIDNCNSDWAVVMDCDLQDNPEDIIHLYNKAKEGFDIVWGERIERKDNNFKKFCSNIFYFISNSLSDKKIERKIGSFSIISKKVIDTLKEINTYTFNYIQMVEYVGFKKTYIPIVKDKRAFGKSGYTLYKSIQLAINNIVSTSNKFLLLPLINTVIIFITILVFVSVCIYNNLFSQNFLTMESQLIILLILLISFILFFNLSIFAVYIETILKEVLEKPHYIIESKKKK